MRNWENPKFSGPGNAPTPRVKTMRDAKEFTDAYNLKLRQHREAMLTNDFATASRLSLDVSRMTIHFADVASVLSADTERRATLARQADWN